MMLGLIDPAIFIHLMNKPPVDSSSLAADKILFRVISKQAVESLQIILDKINYCKYNKTTLCAYARIWNCTFLF
jgi:hypothetical protein